MGRKTILVDDYDGADLPEDTAPISLSLGRTSYNLYLSEKNHGKLLEALEPFIKDAEKVGAPTRTAPKASSNSADKEDQKNARAWAQSTGFKYKDAQGNEKTLGDRGRIPEAVMEGWRVAGSPVMGDD